jgi:hypothetical protein
MAEDLKAVARRTVEEILPNGDVAGLRAVMHPQVVNHEPPAGAPPGLDGMIQAMRWVQGGFSERRFEIHQVIAEGDTVVVHCTFHGRQGRRALGGPRRPGAGAPTWPVSRPGWPTRSRRGIAATGAAANGCWHARPTRQRVPVPGRTIPGLGDVVTKHDADDDRVVEVVTGAVLQAVGGGRHG